jgi:hypothetical protein
MAPHGDGMTFSVLVPLRVALAEPGSMQSATVTQHHAARGDACESCVQVIAVVTHFWRQSRRVGDSSANYRSRLLRPRRFP